MKIAYILHGHSRTWRQCHQAFFDNIFSVAPGDIFIHTWDRINSKTGSWWNGYQFRLDGQLEEISSRTADIDGIKKAYNPKHLIVETDNGADHWASEIYSKYGIHIPPPFMALKNYFYGQHKIFNVAKSFGEYDKYFFTRFDLKFNNKLDVESFSVPQVVIPAIDQRTVFDIWKIADTHQSTIMTEFFNNIDEYFYNSVHLRNKNYNYAIECAVYDYCLDNKIEFILPSITPLYDMVRISHDTT